MDDILLTFNPAQFLGAINQINNSILKMEGTMVKSSNAVDKRLGGVGATFGNLSKLALGFGAAFGAIRTILKNIPEIGRTFSIVGEIVGRNLLWPLRQELIPILQSILDWARDNRAMFVRFGNVLANIFRIIKASISGFFKIMSRFAERLFSHIEGIFGKSVKSVSDFLNILTFKIAAFGQFMLIALEPVFDFLADMIGKTISGLSDFVSAFVEGFGDVSKPIEDFINIFGRLNDIIGKVFGNTSKLNGVMKGLGKALGVITKLIVEAMLQAFDDLVYSIEWSVNRISRVIAGFNDEKNEVSRLNAELDKINKEHTQRRRSRAMETAEVLGLGETKPIPSQINNVGGTSTTNNNFNNDVKIDVMVDGSKSPEETGKEAANRIREELINSRVRTGGH